VSESNAQLKIRPKAKVIMTAAPRSIRAASIALSAAIPNKWADNDIIPSLTPRFAGVNGKTMENVVSEGIINICKRRTLMSIAEKHTNNLKPVTNIIAKWNVEKTMINRPFSLKNHNPSFKLTKMLLIPSFLDLFPTLRDSAGLSISEALAKYDVSRSAYYRWKRKLKTMGIKGLQDNKPKRCRSWNQLLPWQVDKILEYALYYPDF